MPSKRTMNPAGLNAVANDPSVRPWLGGEGALDFSQFASDPANVLWEGEGGGFVVLKHEPGLYEVHTLFLPSARGAAAVETSREGLRYMFLATDCVELLTKCPADNPAAIGFARDAGFQLKFTRKGGWKDGVDLYFYSLSFDRWVGRDEVMKLSGEAFHAELERVKAQAGSPLPTHPDDEAHDRTAGAAVEMVRAGNVRKAVWLYNRWARFAGYASIDLLSESPPVIDVRDAIVTVRDGSMEVLLCR